MGRGGGLYKFALYQMLPSKVRLLPNVLPSVIVVIGVAFNFPPFRIPGGTHHLHFIMRVGTPLAFHNSSCKQFAQGDGWVGRGRFWRWWGVCSKLVEMHPPNRFTIIDDSSSPHFVRTNIRYLW